jgi:hypothetical protein
LIDANLLLLDVVGRCDPRLIPKHKRTAAFTIEDFVLLETLLDQFSDIATTPHVLAEVSNLSGQANGLEVVARLRDALASRVTVLAEADCRATVAVTDPHFRRLGLTDAAIMAVCRGERLLVTADAPLAYTFASRGGDVINFNNLRIGVSL